MYRYLLYGAILYKMKRKERNAAECMFKVVLVSLVNIVKKFTYESVFVTFSVWCFRYLTQYDCVTFYNLVNSIRCAIII